MKTKFGLFSLLGRLGKDEHARSSEDPNESGAALVEFTVIMPLFFLILFGIIEWGLIFFYQNSMTSAAEVTARAVAVTGYTTSTLIKQYSSVCSWVPSYMAGNVNINVTISAPPNPCSYPDPQSVTVVITTSAAKASVINYLTLISGNLSATAAMHWEGVCEPATTIPKFTCP